MKSGFAGEMDTAPIEAAAMDLFLPVMESATVLAAHYAHACNRDVVTGQDMRLGLMYAARHVTGKQIGTLFPELYNSGDEDEDEDEDVWEEIEGEWSKYEGTTNETAVKMNECADTWASWVPETPAELAIKNAVDKQNE
jgi:hypothetical protein